MSNFFTKTKDRIENSPWAIAVFALFLYGFYLSITFFLEDYHANIAVYNMIPTHKTDAAIILNMARFLQIAPVLFGYLWLRDTNKWTNGLVSGFFLAVDWGLGVFYRGNGLEPGWMVYAAIEDFVFFTAGSEILMTLAAGMIVSLLKPMTQQFMHMIVQFFGAEKDSKPADNKDKKPEGIPQHPFPAPVGGNPNRPPMPPPGQGMHKPTLMAKKPNK